LKYEQILLLYLVFINALGAAINIIDKIKAKYDKWRIPEKRLWVCAFLGGAPLSYITMKMIRHKTRHKSFMIGMPILALAQTALFIIIYYKYFMGG